MNTQWHTNQIQVHQLNNACAQMSLRGETDAVTPFKYSELNKVPIRRSRGGALVTAGMVQ